MIFERREQIFAGHQASHHSLAAILHSSYLTAYLLTGNSIQAEKALMEAIDQWNPEEQDEEQLFQITVRTTVQRQMIASAGGSYEGRITDYYLPAELRRVLELSPELRRCFVLRVLVGLPSKICAQMLQVDVLQIDEYSCEAMKMLSVLAQEPLREPSLQLTKTEIT